MPRRVASVVYPSLGCDGTRLGNTSFEAAQPALAGSVYLKSGVRWTDSILETDWRERAENEGSNNSSTRLPLKSFPIW